MSSVRRIKSRPWPATMLAAAALAAVLLLIPVSYQKTVGHDVALTITVPNLGPGQLEKIASEFKAALRAASLTAQVEEDGSAVLKARVPSEAGTQVDQVARAFARGLSERGMPASTVVTPRTERVLGNLYAYARDNIIEIHVSTRGKSPAQVEDEIRSQLEAAGIENPTVEFKQENGQSTLKVEVQKEAAAGNAATEPVTAVERPIKITLDDHQPGEPGTKTRSINVRVNRRPGESDAELVADVQKQLQAQGIDHAKVTVENGKIRIQDEEK